MIIVTGGAGFIGSNLVKALNDIGRTDIMVVDNVANTQKIQNLADLRLIDYMDKDEFFDVMESGQHLGNIEAVFHQGACSDTMETDGQYIMHNNFNYSKAVLKFCKDHNAQFIYASSASVYGAGSIFIEEPVHESTLNAYAWSKLLFDNFVRSQNDIPVQCVGLRYFNVYGPRESHKGRMASVAWHFFNQYQENKQVKLFEGSSEYEDGEQLRDFVNVEDVVKVNLYLLQHPEVSGIFNVGTGKCQSFNDVALAVINSCRMMLDEPQLSHEQAMDNGEIMYIPMPEALHGKYQSYTQADLTKLNASGYKTGFDNVNQGVAKYVSYLSEIAGKAE